MHHVRDHREHETGSFGRWQVVHELQRAFYSSRAACAHSAHIEKKTIVNNIVSETLLENMWEDCNVDDVLYVLGNLQKRDIEYRRNTYAIEN